MEPLTDSGSAVRRPSEVTHFHLCCRASDSGHRGALAPVAKQILDDRTIELTFPANPDGKYLLKGGTPAVWEKFRLPYKWRSRLGEGLIEGKRCGVTQNIGPAARLRTLIIQAKTGEASA